MNIYCKLYNKLPSQIRLLSISTRLIIYLSGGFPDVPRVYRQRTAERDVETCLDLAATDRHRNIES